MYRRLMIIVALGLAQLTLLPASRADADEVEDEPDDVSTSATAAITVSKETDKGHGGTFPFRIDAIVTGVKKCKLLYWDQWIKGTYTFTYGDGTTETVDTCDATRRRNSDRRVAGPWCEDLSERMKPGIRSVEVKGDSAVCAAKGETLIYEFKDAPGRQWSIGQDVGGGKTLASVSWEVSITHKLWDDTNSSLTRPSALIREVTFDLTGRMAGLGSDTRDISGP